jgi:hypothetical protein
MAWSDGSSFAEASADRVMECWGEGIYLRLSDESRYAPTLGWVLWVCLAAVADRRYSDYSKFTIYRHGAIVAWF